MTLAQRLSPEVLENLYCKQRMTQAAIGKMYNSTQTKIAKLMRQRGIKARDHKGSASRISGSSHHLWGGDEINYKSSHARVNKIRGKAKVCEQCRGESGSTFFEWANVSGDYPNPQDYISLCRSCHRRYDARRSKTVKSCRLCKTEFSGAMHTQFYCSPECSKKALRIYMKAYMKRYHEAKRVR